MLVLHQHEIFCLILLFLIPQPRSVRPLCCRRRLSSGGLGNPIFDVVIVVIAGMRRSSLRLSLIEQKTTVDSLATHVVLTLSFGTVVIVLVIVASVKYVVLTTVDSFAMDFICNCSRRPPPPPRRPPLQKRRWGSNCK